MVIQVNNIYFKLPISADMSYVIKNKAIPPDALGMNPSASGANITERFLPWRF